MKITGWILTPHVLNANKLTTTNNTTDLTNMAINTTRLHWFPSNSQNHESRLFIDGIVVFLSADAFISNVRETSFVDGETQAQVLEKPRTCTTCLRSFDCRN